MFEAFRIRDFRLLWFARTVSMLGSWLLVVAIPAHVLHLTGSLAATGLTLAAEFLPPVLLGPVAGALVDRWDRRRVMIATDVLRAGAVLFLLLVDGPQDVWLVYAALVAEGVGTVLFRPAAQAHTPVVVGTGSALTSANTLNSVASGVVGLVGAPLGGVLYGMAGLPVLVVVDMASYVLSAVAILLTAKAAKRPIERNDLLGGVRFLCKEPLVARVLVASTLFLAANAALTALLVPFGVRVLGGATQVGIVLSALSVGYMLGAPLVRRRDATENLLAAALIATGFAFVWLFLTRSLPMAVVAAAVLGACGAAALVTVQTIVQRLTPNEVLGRVSAVQITAEAVVTFLGAVAGPALAQAASLNVAACVAGGVTVLSGLIAGQQMLSDGLGFARPKSGRSLSPIHVPPNANSPQSQPCKLPTEMPPR